jgi:hypothetical protein
MKTSRIAGSSLLALGILIISGCSSAQTSNTARTAREQLLISNAVDQSLAKVNFSSLAGAKVFLEEKYMDSVDKPYILGTLRHQVLRSGASVVDKAEDADVIMEARSGGVGTDMSEKYLGIPEIALPGLLTLPEIRFAENKAQQGYAKIGLVVLDAKSKTMLGQGGTSSALSDDNNWYVLGVGPFQNGSLRNEINYASQSPPGVEQRIIPRNVAFGRGGSTSGLSGSRLRLASGKKEMARESNADWERE